MATLRRLLAPTADERRAHPYTLRVWIRIAAAAIFLWRAADAATHVPADPHWLIAVAVSVLFLVLESRGIPRVLRENLRTDAEILAEHEHRLAERARKRNVRENRALLRKMERDRREREDEA